jgi:hypothetical protein
MPSSAGQKNQAKARRAPCQGPGSTSFPLSRKTLPLRVIGHTLRNEPTGLAPPRIRATNVRIGAITQC